MVLTSSPPGCQCEYRDLSQPVRPRASSWLASTSLLFLPLWDSRDIHRSAARRIPQHGSQLQCGRCSVWTCPRRDWMLEEHEQTLHVLEYLQFLCLQWTWPGKSFMGLLDPQTCPCILFLIETDNIPKFGSLR